MNISSTASQIARGGTVQLTKVLAIELGEHGVRVNTVCAGVVGSERGAAMSEETPGETRVKLARVPQGRLGEPIEVADTIVFLGSPSASYVTGAVWNVDGGYTCGIPRY